MTTTISEAGLAVLRAATVTATSVSIGTPEDNPLERATYTEIAEVLTTCGAKWNRAKKVHVFTATWDGKAIPDFGVVVKILDALNASR